MRLIEELTYQIYKAYTGMSFPIKIEVCELRQKGFVEFIESEDEYICTGFGYSYKTSEDSVSEQVETVCHELAHYCCCHPHHNDEFVKKKEEINVISTKCITRNNENKNK